MWSSRTITRYLTALACSACSASHPPAVVRDSEGLTPLHVAAGRGDTARVVALLRDGADPLAVDGKMGVSVLHKAVYSGNPDTVGALVERGALVDVQSPSNGDTPLHDAIYFRAGKDMRIIRLLVDRGASLAIRNRAGLTPVESARLLHADDVASLLEQAARARRTESGMALMKAVRENDVDAARVALESGHANVAETDEQGFTPLLWASREGFAPLVALLLDHGADPNQNDQWMRANAGHKAAFWGRAEVMKLLLAHHLNLDARGGYNGYTPLHDAVAQSHLETVEVLLDAGARTDIRGHDGKTALDLAKAQGNAAILAALAKARTR